MIVISFVILPLELFQVKMTCIQVSHIQKFVYELSETLNLVFLYLTLFEQSLTISVDEVSYTFWTFPPANNLSK